MKYELTQESIEVSNRKLYRIRALKDFGDVKAGDFGGFVESENNLSQEGSAWVFDEAKVYGEAQIYDKAKVYNEAQIYDKAQVYGEAWVFDKAQVYGEAQICGGALVFDKAKVYGGAVVFDKARVCGEALIGDTKNILTIGNIGSRCTTCTFIHQKESILVATGCFSGDIEEFEKAVKYSHGTNAYAVEYLAAIEFVKKIWKVRV